MSQHRKLIWPAYAVAFSLAVIPPIEATLQTLPFRLGDERWRFGFFGLMSNALMIPMIGLLIAFVIASLAEHGTLKRVLGAIAAVIAVVTLGALCLFGLDVIQVRGAVSAAGQKAFLVASLTATIKALVGIVTLAGFARAGLTGGGSKPKTEKSAERELVVGRSTKAPKSDAAAPKPEAVV